MKEEIHAGLKIALSSLMSKLQIDKDCDYPIEVERCKDAQHGDFSSNIAMKYARLFKMNPRQLADNILLVLPYIPAVISAEVAGVGFINFRIAHEYEMAILEKIVQMGSRYGQNNYGEGNKIILEFVSANPTGPLHVGHGRGAAYGATLANVLRANGYEVNCEYYVNDAGRQIDILTLSAYWRYLQLCFEDKALPQGLYQGDYLLDIAKNIYTKHENKFAVPWQKWLPQENQDDEQWIDAAIANLKNTLQTEDYAQIASYALDAILSDIKNDLSEFGVNFDNWFSERQLYDEQMVADALQILDNNGFLYKNNGATWFKATKLGDEKDRVVVRENGAPTYFASDIAYHWNKKQRGYTQMIDVFGADHHGYMARVRAALAALQLDEEELTIVLVQFAVLYQNNEKVQMSTRSGNFVTLRQLRETVGNDAARFFYAVRKPDQHLDFNIDLAVSHSKDNPFYYVEYAHARTCQVLDKANNEGLNVDFAQGLQQRLALTSKQEKQLLQQLSQYPEIINNAREQLSGHVIVHYLRELATLWHQYYESGTKLLHEDQELRAARLTLTHAVGQVLRNGLNTIGVCPLSRM